MISKFNRGVSRTIAINNGERRNIAANFKAKQSVRVEEFMERISFDFTLLKKNCLCGSHPSLRHVAGRAFMYRWGQGKEKEYIGGQGFYIFLALTREKKHIGKQRLSWRALRDKGKKTLNINAR